MSKLELEIESWLSAAKHMQTRSLEEALAQLERVEGTISTTNRAFLTSCHGFTEGDKALAEAIAARAELIESLKSNRFPHVARWWSCCLGMYVSITLIFYDYTRLMFMRCILCRMKKRDVAVGVIQYKPTLFPIPGVVSSSSSVETNKASENGGAPPEAKKEEKVSFLHFMNKSAFISYAFTS